jgi:hypothetical protein
MAGRPAAGGGRWVEVDPARLPRWLAGFEERHGSSVKTIQEYGVSLAAPDGALADLHSPPGAPSVSTLDDFVEEAQRPRRLGLVLARRGAVAVGIVDGEKIVVSKVDSSYVQGRTAAGGWSQHRYARRRDNQAKAAASGAADIVARLLLPALADLAAVVAGGDRRAVDAVLDDSRLGPVAARRVETFLDVGEPRLAVLHEAARRVRAVRIRVRDPA